MEGQKVQRAVQRDEKQRRDAQRFALQSQRKRERRATREKEKAMLKEFLQTHQGSEVNVGGREMARELRFEGCELDLDGYWECYRQDVFHLVEQQDLEKLKDVLNRFPKRATESRCRGRSLIYHAVHRRYWPGADYLLGLKQVKTMLLQDDHELDSIYPLIPTHTKWLSVSGGNAISTLRKIRHSRNEKTLRNEKKSTNASSGKKVTSAVETGCAKVDRAMIKRHGLFGSFARAAKYGDLPGLKKLISQDRSLVRLDRRFMTHSPFYLAVNHNKIEAANLIARYMPRSYFSDEPHDALKCFRMACTVRATLDQRLDLLKVFENCFDLPQDVKQELQMSRNDSVFCAKSQELSRS